MRAMGAAADAFEKRLDGAGQRGKKGRSAWARLRGGRRRRRGGCLARQSVACGGQHRPPTVGRGRWGGRD
jgi:hypothetical protein